MGERGGLFEDLPEQVSPERADGGGVPRLRRAERRQVEWRLASLDDLVGEDHRVRQVWAFACGLDLGPLTAGIRSVEGRPGHPCADPRLLLALWLYATLEGVGSARALARLCEEHRAYRWLVGGVGTNHKSLADFRVAHGAVLERLLIDGFAAMLHAGLASLQEVAQDGTRVRAHAGAASFRRFSTLKACRRAAAARVAALRAELQADPAAASRRQQAARERAARERLERVERALADAAELARQRGLDPDASPTEPEPEVPSAAEGTGAPPDAKEPRVSTTDAEAKVMKMADGGFRPAFDVQFVSDTASGMIALVAVGASGSDLGKMVPANDRLEELYGERPERHLVDGGYTKLADIDTLEGRGCQVFAPAPRARAGQRDRWAPRDTDPPGAAAWRARMGTDEGAAIYRHRAATAELANAQARNRGLRQFLVRGTVKAKAVALWFALVHNMTRCWALTPA